MPGKTPRPRRIRDGRAKGVSALIYGDPGSGKTRLAASASGRVLIMRPPIEHTDSVPAESAAEEIVLSTWQDAFDAREWLRHGGADDYDWVWLDSISLFQYTGLDDIWKITVDERPGRARYGLDKGEYGINMTRLGQFVRDLVSEASNGAFNFGCTATVREGLPTEDESESDMKKMPWVQGKNMAAVTAGYFGLVGYLAVSKNGVRTLHVQGSEDWYAKDQFDAVPKGKLVGDDIYTIFERIEAARKAQPATAKKAGRPASRRRTSKTTTKKRA